ncbi:DUF3606 domain-containing protein [Massilia sp. MP_M2]|uniref:DUF3606 domain-containing protein n=1 Tax=Massilia sp. MP_M2 TaxID=3071713 RepID=UPI00319E1A73
MSNRGNTDRHLIGLTEHHEVRYWTDALGISSEELERVVHQVGNSAAKVRQHLKK